MVCGEAATPSVYLWMLHDNLSWYCRRYMLSPFAVGPRLSREHHHPQIRATDGSGSSFVLMHRAVPTLGSFAMKFRIQWLALPHSSKICLLTRWLGYRLSDLRVWPGLTTNIVPSRDRQHGLCRYRVLMSELWPSYFLHVYTIVQRASPSARYPAIQPYYMGADHTSNENPRPHAALQVRMFTMKGSMSRCLADCSIIQFYRP